MSGADTVVEFGNVVELGNGAELEALDFAAGDFYLLGPEACSILGCTSSIIRTVSLPY